MSESFLSGRGETTGVTTSGPIQLLDPAGIHGATGFYYDFWIRGEDSNAAGRWEIDDVGYGAMPGGSGVSGEGDVEMLSGIEIGPQGGASANTGLVMVSSTGTGTVSWYYALNGGAGQGLRPSVRGCEGSASAAVEFYLERGRRYTVVSDGTHSWEYATDVDALLSDGAGWTVFAEGTTDGFSFDCPATGRMRLDPTGAVNFVITSRKY